MRFFAISDLHLPGGKDKPMDVFGPEWTDHFEKIKADWLSKVTDEDAVLMPGDLSWAMTLAEAMTDIELIASLPGSKIILRGNHDYWWPSAKKLREALPEGIYAVQNDSVNMDGTVVWGTRGWIHPDTPKFSAEDEKIYLREIARLRLSLGDMEKRFPGMPSIVMMHYPPFGPGGSPTPFTDVIAESGAVSCVYGHIHRAGSGELFSGLIDGVMYRCVSCDMAGFRLAEI